MFCTEVSFPNSQLTSFTQSPVHFFFFYEKIIALQNFCCFLSVINKNQPQVYPCPLPPKLLPISLPIPLF